MPVLVCTSIWQVTVQTNLFSVKAKAKQAMSAPQSMIENDLIPQSNIWQTCIVYVPNVQF
jgi:hypothetical protein